MRLKIFSSRPRVPVRKDQTFWLVDGKMDGHKLFFHKEHYKKICNTLKPPYKYTKTFILLTAHKK